MKAERQSRGWLTPFQGCGKVKIFIFICVVTVVLSGSCLPVFGETSPKGDVVAEQGAISGVARYRVFSLKHISAEQGKKYLAEVGVGTVSQLPGVNTLLVTAQPEELVKASAILELVDAEESFDIKTIFPASDVAKFPSNEQIAAKVGDISIGTFSNPPSGTAKTKVILDVHNGSVIAVAPAGQIERIISAVEQLQSGGAQTQQLVPKGGSEPNKSAKMIETSEAETETIAKKAESTKAELKRAEEELKRIKASSKSAGQADTEVNEPNELFSKLLNSIAETEKTTAGEQVRQLSQPNAVTPTIATQTAAGVPETNEPNKPSAGLKQKEESAPQITEEPQSAEHLMTEPNMSAEEPESEQNLKPVSKVHSYEPAPFANGNEMLELDLPAKINIIDLVDLVGKYLQLDYMYDEIQVKGEVSLKLQGPVKVKDLYPLLESVLKFKGFVMTRKGNLVTIVPAADALGIDPVLHPDERGVQLGDVVITDVFRLKYIDTGSAQNLLSSMRLGANITPIPETGTLIVTEYAYRMARVEELLDMVDQPGAPKQFRFRQLKYTMAATLASKIKSLAEQLGTVSVTIAATSPAQPSARRVRGRPETPAPAAPAAAPAATPAAAPAATPAAAAKAAVYLDADERTNRILMIGLEEQLLVVDSLIDALDVEQQDLRTLRLYDIQHVGADEVLKKLGELGIISGGKTTTGRITAGAKTTTPGAPGTTAPATPASAATTEVEPIAGEPQVVVIESTNSLLVNATAEQHVQIATIISYVDSETLKQAIPYVIYALENQNPDDLADVLQKFIQETIKDKEGKVQQTIKKTEEDIIIVPDKNTFSILVYASKKNQEWIGSLIRQLDKRRPQVLIDVMLVSVTEDDSFTYDLQLVSKLPEMAAGGSMTGVIGSALLPTFPSGTVKELASNPATTGLQGFYADSHIQALLTLMQTKGYGRVLARPKILVNDNEKGHIDTTTTIYVAQVTSQYLPSTTVVTTPGTTTPTNTAITSTNFATFPSGIKLDITPHISEGSLLRLEVQVSRSSQAPPPAGSQANTPPGDKIEDNVNTVVTVPDNRTIILGGIITLNQAKNNSKVPFLGDIPIAGGLFRSISNTGNQAKLYVFVKANILRPENTGGLADLQKMSDRNRGAVERFEQKFEEHQDWPGVKPEPVEPLHVLESE
jgi:type II secretory pathway component GspD/PulD (secretin)